MGERTLTFEDVNVGDEAPVITHKLTRTDLVRYAGASGDFNPMHHRRGGGQGGRSPSRVRARDVLDGPPRQPP